MENNGTTVFEIINTVNAVVFAVALFASAAWAGRRLDRYLRAGMRPPLLLWRDTALMVGLVIPFGGVLFFRAVGISERMATNPWWVVPSGALAALAMLVWAYFEFYVIERIKPGQDPDLWDPFLKPYGEVTERPWESPSRSASDPADTPVRPPSPPPGDESEPPTWRKDR